MKVGIVGCGAMGSQIASACTSILKDRIELVGLYDLDNSKAENLLRSLKKGKVKKSLDELIDVSDLVVEAAGADISRNLTEKCIKSSKSVLIMSVGGLIDSESIFEKARKKKVKVYFPSGALSGIDGLKSAKEATIESVTLITKKPPSGLFGAPYLKEKNIDINSITKETIIFDGDAMTAVKGFPKNVNVASILSIAGLGARRTNVKIVTSPEFRKNVHEVVVNGSFGKITTRTENIPSENNPKTSKLAILSAIATLRGITDSIRIGT